jgi:hypothetical protein
MVHTDLLLECMGDLGVPQAGPDVGCTWALLPACTGTPMTVKSETSLDATFDSSREVKQGKPLSHLLFGLLIDRVEHWLRGRAPDSRH